MAVSEDEHSASVSVAYKKFSKSNNCDWEVLIQSNDALRNEKSDESKLRTLFCVSIIVSLIVAFVTCFMIFYPNSYDVNPSCYVDDFCDVLEKVEKIVLTVSERSNYSCFDEKSCRPLFDQMEEDGYGMKYNFIVGSGFPTYAPVYSGSHCAIKGSQDTLHIKIIRHNQSIEHFLEEVHRVADVVLNGINCGKISTNFTIMDAFEKSRQLDPEFHVELLTKKYEINNFQPRHHTFFNYVVQIKALVSKGEITHDCSLNLVEIWWTKKDDSKAINGSSQCLEYKPADIVIVTVEEGQSLHKQMQCWANNSEFNLILSRNLDMYKQQGFKCGTKFNVLKIKVLEPTPNEMFDKHYSDGLFEFINNGVKCKKISPNFTFVMKCLEDCEQRECSHDTLTNWHGEFHNFKTSKSKWLSNETYCPFLLEPFFGSNVIDHLEEAEVTEEFPTLEVTDSTLRVLTNESQTQDEDVILSTWSPDWDYYNDFFYED